MSDMKRESIRAFLANLRHELRTPLNAIIGYSEMLLEEAEDEGQEELIPDLQTVHTAGQELLAAVNDVLDPAKIAAGALDDIELETLEINLRHEMLTSVSTIIGCSGKLLAQAQARELVSLAELQKIRAAGERFLACISDPAKIRAGITDSGLEDTDDTSAMAQHAMATAHSLEHKVNTGPADRGYLLVVDDNEMNRDILSRYLEQQGHGVAVAENGRQALEMVNTHSFDLVLLDIVMPEMDGYQVLQRLKADATWRDIPVIMISALDEIDSVVRCIELGAEDYLPKPFDPVLLKARIGAGLEKKRLRDLEVEYLRNVAHLTGAAAAVEAGTFDADSLADVAARLDELGQLARVFQHMAREVYAREQRLKQQVQQLSIELDEARQARQVAEITETEYFRQLQAKAQDLRKTFDDL
jgi:DNA-binding response OmpR family regulator